MGPSGLWERGQRRTTHLACLRLPAPPFLLAGSLVRMISANFNCPAFDRKGWADSIAPAQSSFEPARERAREMSPRRVLWTSLPAVSPSSPSASARGIIRLRFLGQAGFFPPFLPSFPRSHPHPSSFS